MATLTGKKISESYKDLLQVSNSNSGVDATLRDIEDGEGTASILQISSASINIKNDGALQINETAVTSTAAELNILDGVTATTAEINYLDGVTSNIQTQLNAKIEATLTTEQVEDIVGGMLDGTKTGISVSYDDTDGNIDFVVATQSDNNFTTTLLNKLNAIEDSATADQTASEIRTLVDSASDSNVFTDADHSKLDGIEASATADQTDAEIRTAVEAASDSNVFTDADHSKLDGIEASADVTDTANVTSAGALMDSELTSIADVKALDQSVISGASPTFGTANMSDASNKRFMTDAQETKLDSVESNADVTDTANVTSAGALMDSEVTNLSFVKGLTSGISSGNVLVANANVADNDFLKIDGTSVEGRTAAEVRSDLNVEDGATADQTAADIRGLGFFDTSNDGATSGLDADLLDGQHGSHYLDFGNFVIDDDEIPIAKLASDNVSYGGVSVTLGASDATPAFNLSDATSLPIVAGTTGTLSVARGGTGQTSLDNFITLGSMTVGNYAASVAGTTNEIEVTGTAGEGTAFTIGLPADVVISNSLTVNGTTTTIDTQNLIVEDPLIKLAKTNNAADSVDIGFYGLYDTSGSQDLYAGLFRDANDSGKFKLFKDLQDEPTTTVDVSGTGYAKATLVADIEGNVTGNATGNAGTATALATGRDISLTGDVTGTTNTVFDGTGNVSIAASIANNSVDLGTHTTGNYVATLTAGNLIDLQNNSGEGATPTIDVDLSELSTSTSDGDGDFFAVVDSSNAQKKLTKGNINLSGFNNDSGFTSNAGTVTSVTVTGGDGLTGGGSAITSSGSATLAVGSSSLAVTTNAVDIAFSALSTISDSIATDDNIIFFDSSNSNAVQINAVSDLPFTNNAGTITSVTGGTGLTGSGSSGGVTVNVGAGTGISVSSSAVSTNDSEIVHDNLSGFVANEHIDHSGVSITAGNGLTGGGTIASTRSLAVGAGDGIAVNANDVEVDFSGLAVLNTDSEPLTSQDTVVVYNQSADAIVQLSVDDIGGGAVSAVANGSNDRIATFSSSTALNGEANLTFDGTTLNVNGDVKVGVGADGQLTSVNNGLAMRSLVSDADMYFYVNDGGVDTLALKIDASENGKAIFSDSLKIPVGKSVFFGGSEHTFIREVSDDNLTIAVGGTNLLDLVEDTTDYVRVRDNTLLAVGSSNDMNFKHDGTNSFIDNGTGNLTIRNQTDDGVILFQCDDGSGGVTDYIRINGNESLTRFKKSTRHNDNIIAQFGSSNDLQIKHDGSHSYIENDTGDLYIQNTANDKDIVLQSDDGSGGVTAYLTLDGSATRIKVDKDVELQDSVKLKVGTSDDAIFYHDGSNTFLDHSGTGNFHIRNQKDDQDLILSCDDGSGGVASYITLDGSAGYTTVQKTLRLDDDVQLHLGTGNDLKIYHNSSSSNNNIDNHNGSLYVTNYVDDADIIFRNDNGSGGVTNYMVIDGGAVAIDLLQDTRLKAAKKLFLDGGGNTYIFEESGDNVVHYVGGQNKLRFNSTGAIFNDAGLALDFRVEGDTDANLLFVDGSADKIGIGTNSPSKKLEVAGDVRIASGGDLILSDSGGGNDTFLYNDSETLIGYINGAERFRFNSSGFLGIGTSSPDEELHIFGAAPFIKIENSTETSGGILFVDQQDEGQNASIRFDASARSLDFLTDSGEAMTILGTGSSRRVGIGETSPISKLHVQDANNISMSSAGVGQMSVEGNGYTLGIALNGSGAFIYHNSSSRFLSLGTNETEQVRLTTGGALHVVNDVVAFSTTPSDKRLKTNVKDIDYGLDTIMKLKPKQYDWKKDDRHDIGFIAQEVEEVIPEIVKDNEWFDDKVKTLDYEKLTAVLIKAVQEQQVQIEELKTKLGE